MNSRARSKKMLRKKKAKAKRIRMINTAISSVTIIVLAFTFSVIFRNHLYGNDKYILGYRSYITASENMSPIIQKGGSIITQHIKTESLQVGDIITYLDDSEILTQRIAEIADDGGVITYITKGDACDGVNSKPVSSDAVIGRFVYSINHAGSVILALRNPILMSLCVAGVCVCFIAADMIVQHYKKRARKKKRQKWQYPSNDIRMPVNNWRPVQKDLNSMELVIPNVNSE